MGVDFRTETNNHATDSKLNKEWESIYVKIAAILESYTDGEE